MINKILQQKNIFKNLDFLKYICGGIHKDTEAQHEIIEYVAKKNNLNIVGQEAEIERLGFSVFNRHAFNINPEKNFNAIIIASNSVLDRGILDQNLKKALPIYSALEGCFIN